MLLVGFLLAILGAMTWGVLRERGIRQPWTAGAIVVTCAGVALVILHAPMGAP